mmetsp:Transcript_14825/g.26061  ORF Transcript_14825/g.26061 Transcript_14825/m.26061 type:complete len:96 (-) Transcript_14825:1514-1801(-)
MLVKNMNQCLVKSKATQNSCSNCPVSSSSSSEAHATTQAKVQDAIDAQGNLAGSTKISSKLQDCNKVDHKNKASQGKVDANAPDARAKSPHDASL